MKTQSADALQRAIDIVGTPTALARQIGRPVSSTHIYNWMRRDKAGVPLERCPDIERVTGGRVRCEELRPDLAGMWAYLRGTAPAETEKQEEAA